MIARGALSKAFRHAKASDILCAIKFTERHVIPLCEDDGIGIDPQFVSNSGRPGHWELIGMRGGGPENWSHATVLRSAKAGLR